MAKRNLVPFVKPSSDPQLLAELLKLLTKFAQDPARLAQTGRNDHGVPVLTSVARVINALVAFVIARSSDPGVLLSQQLARLAEARPYTQLLGEEHEQISVATAAEVLREWNGSAVDRTRMFEELSRALLDILEEYGTTAGTFFEGPDEREAWRETFGVFVNDLRAAVQQVAA